MNACYVSTSNYSNNCTVVFFLSQMHTVGLMQVNKHEQKLCQCRIVGHSFKQCFNFLLGSMKSLFYSYQRISKRVEWTSLLEGVCTSNFKKTYRSLLFFMGVKTPCPSPHTRNPHMILALVIGFIY